MNNKILSAFFIWRISLFFIAFLAVLAIPVFGNRFPYANTVLIPTKLPAWIWGFGNFDGVHYLRIAQDGYKAEFSQAFFPLFPILVRIFNFFPKNALLDTRIYTDPSYFYTGLLISNLFFLLSLAFFYKLLALDFNKKIAFSSLLLLLAFPTSFYFGSVYTESLFLLLFLGAIYFLRKNNFLLAGIFGALSSATRIFGLLIIPVFIVELILKIKKKELNLDNSNFIKGVLGMILVPSGFLLYTLFLKVNFENPLYFLSAQPNFGAERISGGVILLPQVLYRYLKIFVTVPLTSQLFFNAFLEFFFTITILTILFIFIKKIRISYFIFILGCLIVPTLTGTLSSMPRYALMSFLIFPQIVMVTGKYFKFVLLLCTFIQVLLLGLFVRGYWVA